jgi:hypothetical protein
MSGLNGVKERNMPDFRCDMLDARRGGILFFGGHHRRDPGGRNSARF